MCAMSAQDSKQSDIQTLAPQAAAAGSTPLSRLVPSASAVSDRSIDEWVEREQRRGRCSVKLGVAVLAGISLAAIALAVF